ncbi:hypothetical protein LBMAG57_31580 [Verrucomicrobiota bacterium]|nr:hypothetical protein LBMAG57_31580 [Verrucomicrobiota bacterium]
MHGTHKYGFLLSMKTTLEIPDPLFRKAKATAAQHGVTLREFVNDALREKLSGDSKVGAREPAWMKFFGSGKPFAASIREIDRAVEEEFERIEDEDRK